MTINCPFLGKTACDKSCAFRKPGSDEEAKKNIPVNGIKVCWLVSLAATMEAHYREEIAITKPIDKQDT